MDRIGDFIFGAASRLLRRDPLALTVAASVAAAAIIASALARRRRSLALVSGVAVVTGASSGIGAAFARLVASRGAHVVLLARSAAPLAALAAEIKAAGGSASWHAVDCADGAAVDAMAVQVLAEHGVPTLVVCSAGAGQWKALWEMSVTEVQRTVDAPFMAAALVSRAFLPAMLAAGAPRQSSLVYVQSPASVMPWAGSTMYAACRGALHTLATAVRADINAVRGRPDVRVTEVICGEVDSAYFDHAGAGTRSRIPGISVLIKPVLSCDAAARAVWAGAVSGRDTFIAPLMLGVTSALADAPVLGRALRACIDATAWTTTPAEVLAAQAAVRASQ